LLQEDGALMDMHVALPARPIGAWYETTATEYASLAEHRRQVFALIGEFRGAVARPRGRRDALRILKALVPCSDTYFAVVESLLDKISGAGAAPHRTDHRRIVDELRATLEGCSSAPSESGTADLAHALDTLVMHEATIRVRASEHRSSSR
jgi:hypothetical protein